MYGHCFPIALHTIASPFALRELLRFVATTNWSDCRIRLLSQLAVYGSLKHTTTMWNVPALPSSYRRAFKDMPRSATPMKSATPSLAAFRLLPSQLSEVVGLHD